MQTSGWTPAYRSTSATLTAHGSAAPMRTPMGCCASTFPKAPTSACTAPRRLQPWRPPSTPAPERRLGGKHLPRRLISCFGQPTNIMLRRPLESALATLVGIKNLGFTILGKRRLDRLKAEIDGQGDRHPPGQHLAAEPVHHGRQVDKAACHRHVGDLHALVWLFQRLRRWTLGQPRPSLVALFNRHTAQQIWINLVPGTGL